MRRKSYDLVEKCHKHTSSVENYHITAGRRNPSIGVEEYSNNLSFVEICVVSGLALTALWYLGQAQVTPRVIESIRENLSPEAFLQLKVEAHSMPGWMADTLRRHEQGGLGV